MSRADDNPVCRRFLVQGRVQGVWFRDSTRSEALRLDIRGYAKNLADGAVEVVAVGEAAAVCKLLAWLQQGPPLATVSTVTELDATVAAFESFSVL